MSESPRSFDLGFSFPVCLFISRHLSYAVADIFHLPATPGASTLPNAKLKSELTRERFASFLEWLNPDRERAGEEYELLWFRLCTFFTQRRCSFADELADETINRVMLKVSEEKIESKIAYCYGVAKNIYREWLRKQRTHVDIDEVTIPARAPEEPTLSSDCLDKCLKELSPETQSLLLEYFSEVKLAKIELHRRIAASMKMTQTALRMQVMRGKQKLKICVQECMDEAVT